MTSFYEKFLRGPLRKILLRMLILMEKKSGDKPPLTRKESLLQRDIHVPPILVAIGSALLLLTVLILQMGWSWSAFSSLSIFILLILLLFLFYLKHDFPKLIRDDEAIMLLGTLTVFFTAIIGSFKEWPVSFYLTPLPAAAILATLLLHARLSIVFTTILSILMAMVHHFSLECFFLSFLGCMSATASTVYIRTHRDFVRTGGIISATQLLTLVALTLFEKGPLANFFWNSLWVALNGFFSAVLALGILPFLESFFSRATPMKLMELADFNQPLLKRLMVEAPGTYHHSLIMATLAESAAQAIGANPLLCRVGAYYHDIGKLVKPEYFIENQGNAEYNPHQNLAPALSSLIVISHVKEGIALARAAKLPPEIANFIPMHHGTSRIEYFYHRAKENAQEELLLESGNGNQENLDEIEVEEENYRYPGPKPETKETAILMLADAVEAASKTISEPSHLRFKDLVEKIVRKKFSDGQLSDSPLTLTDLNVIQNIFVNTLTSIHHARIDYPEEESG